MMIFLFCSKGTSRRASGTRVVLPAPGGAWITAEDERSRVSRSRGRISSMGSLVITTLKEEPQPLQVDADERRDYPARSAEAFLGVAVGHRQGLESRPRGGGDPGRGVLDGETESGDDPLTRECGRKPRHR